MQNVDIIKVVILRSFIANLPLFHSYTNGTIVGMQTNFSKVQNREVRAKTHERCAIREVTIFESGWCFIRAF